MPWSRTMGGGEGVFGIALGAVVVKKDKLPAFDASGVVLKGIYGGVLIEAGDAVAGVDGAYGRYDSYARGCPVGNGDAKVVVVLRRTPL